MKQILLSLLALLMVSQMMAQSLEIMPGTERVFVDAQWLKFFDQDQHWSLFSRSRATADYDNQTDLFTGAYVNYTTSSGFGGTVVGRIGSRGAGSDLGVHFFKANSKFLIYALASVEMSEDPNYSWFSIMRYTPSLSTHWKAYSSLELFTSFNSLGHLASVQRIRLGADRSGYQFGLALNLSGLGEDYSITDSNPGIFFRKQF
jgi:hypothetical protein